MRFRKPCVLAYNDVFFLIGCGAALGFVIMLVRWLRDRRRGYSPLAADLSILQQMLAQRK